MTHRYRREVRQDILPAGQLLRRRRDQPSLRHVDQVTQCAHQECDLDRRVQILRVGLGRVRAVETAFSRARVVVDVPAVFLLQPARAIVARPNPPCSHRSKQWVALFGQESRVLATLEVRNKIQPGEQRVAVNPKVAAVREPEWGQLDREVHRARHALQAAGRVAAAVHSL